jgi:hypothetical protein
LTLTWRLTVDAGEMRTFGDEQGRAGFSHKTSREMNAGLRTPSRTPLLVHAAD